jgi:hypothetical protein
MNEPRFILASGGKLFVSDAINDRILVFNTVPSANDASADFVLGQVTFSGDSGNMGGAPAANTLVSPRGMVVVGGKLIVADRGNNRILIWNTLPTAMAQAADVVIGQPNMTSNAINQGGVSPTAATLHEPYALATDGTKLFVADRNNNRVLIYNSIPTVDGASADLVLGQPDMFSALPDRGGSTAANSMDAPDGIEYVAGQLLVSDRDNDRVLVYTSVPTADDTAPDYVLGQSSMTSGGSGLAQDRLYNPQQVYSDGQRIYVPDAGNNRVMIWNSLPGALGSKTESVLLYLLRAYFLKLFVDRAL